LTFTLDNTGLSDAAKKALANRQAAATNKKVLFKVDITITDAIFGGTIPYSAYVKIQGVTSE
jgi:hypothetical protein